MTDAPTPRSAPEETARLTEFARACKAAARAVLLYPPAIRPSPQRSAASCSITSRRALPAPLKITVLPDGLLLDEPAAGPRRSGDHRARDAAAQPSRSAR